MTEYLNPKNRFSYYSLYDVISVKATEDVFEGEIVAVDSSGNLVAYHPANSSLKPVGVVVSDDAKAGDLITVAVRGNFGDVYATLKLTDTFSGDGSTTSFTLTRAPKEVISVVVDGSELSSDQYTIADNVITFSTAPAAGTDNVVVKYKAKPTIDDMWKLLPGIIIEFVKEM